MYHDSEKGQVINLSVTALGLLRKKKENAWRAISRTPTYIIPIKLKVEVMPLYSTSKWSKSR